MNKRLSWEQLRVSGLSGCESAAERLGVPIGDSVVVGDSVWDLLAARRARALGVGLLSGGYGKEELERAGAYRVYQDPADLLRHLDEVGVRAAK
jgi:phosphoglycolate phosphatase-like HAD superfamily hydrolase